MFEQYVWTPLNDETVGPFLRVVNPIRGRYTINEATARLSQCALPFYSKHVLVWASDTSWPADVGPFWLLVTPGRVFLLDGASAPVHDVNESDPIEVTDDNVLDYLRFFTYFVQGDEGPFLIVEDLEHPALDTEKLTPSHRLALEETIRPPVFDGREADGAMLATASILYGADLFTARFSITRNGMIEMIDDEPVAADLPVREDPRQLFTGEGLVSAPSRALN